MDIRKEREAFENWWENLHNGRQISCDYVEKDNSYSVGYANAQWAAWQAAKAQAIPEGFVLVSKEISLSALKEGLQYLPADCLSIDLEKAYLAIVKAQEQGHDSM